MSARFRASWLEGHRVDVAALRRTDVIGIGHVMSEIDSLIARLRDPARAAAMGVDPPRGILLWGEPGVGKTLVARYLAASLGADVPFYEVAADELTPDRIRGSLRHLALHHQRSVLYLDEIDTIGLHRDFGLGASDTETKLRLTALLASLDGIVSTAGPVVIASSNRPPEHLDAALVRSGRLGFKVRFDSPDEGERTELFALFTRAVPTDPGLDWQHAARLTQGKTPADLRQLVDDAAGLALAADRERVEIEDVLAAIRRGGMVEPENTIDPGTRSRIAIHESGHVAVAVATRGPSYVTAVRIGAIEASTTVGREDIPVHHQPDDEIRDRLAIDFGGIAAEIAILGAGSMVGGSDVGQATLTALGRITAGVTNDPSPLHLDHLGRYVADSLKEALALALVDPIADARSRAIEIVARNVGPIARFAASLEASGELTGEGLAEAIAAAGFVAEAVR